LQLKELLAMASNNNDTSLTYPTIPDFITIKKEKEVLLPFSELVTPEKKIESVKQAEEGEAIITVPSGSIQAKLLSGKDMNSKKLELPAGNSSYKPKKYGEKIKVKIVFNKGGNIEKLVFISKL